MELVMFFIPGIMLLTPVVLLIIFLRYRTELTKERYRTLLQLADKGVDLPHHLLVEPQASGSDRRKALVLISSGIGLMAMLVALPFELHGGQRIASLWGLGLLPLMTGVGYLVNWWLNHRVDLRG